MEDSFIIINNKTNPSCYLLNRHNIINNICNGLDNSYLTHVENIVKLCRLCISDICKKLIELSNEEIYYYNKYSEYTMSCSSGSGCSSSGCSVNGEMLKCKDKYTNYIKLYKKLKECKLLKGECSVCKIKKIDINEYTYN